MKTTLYAAMGILLLSNLASAATPENSPIGLWKTFSDSDGMLISEVRITESAGVLSGHIERVHGPRAQPDALCTECNDERKNLPIIGLQIIRNSTRAGALM